MGFTANIDEVVAENRNKLLGNHPSWKRVRLKEVVTILNGYPFESARFTKDKGTPLIRIRDILDGRTETFYDGDFDSTFLVKSGEILIGMDGDFHCEPWTGEPALLNQRVYKITPDESRYAKQFLRYLLPGYLTAINAQTPSVTVKHPSSRTDADIPLPLPPFPEQRRIVAEIENKSRGWRRGWVAAGAGQPQTLPRRRPQSRLRRPTRLYGSRAIKNPKSEFHNRFESGEQLLKRILAERRQHWLARRSLGEGGTGRGQYKEPAAPDTASLAPLPAGWTWASVEQLADPDRNSITDGPFASNLKSDYNTESGPRVIRLKNIGDGIFIDARAHISQTHFERL